MIEYKNPINKTKKWGTIKTMLLYLGYVQEDYKPEIQIDMTVTELLRKL